MTQSEGDTTTERKFTQAEVDRVVRDRLAREREKYADYDDLKAKAAEFDKNKSQLDRIEAKLAESDARAEKAERANLLREVADELDVDMKTLRRLRLEGDTKEALLADGRSAMEDTGIKPRGKSTKEKDGAATGNEGDDENGDTGTNRNDENRDDDRRQRRTPAQRPQENLRSGGGTAPSREETDPGKLAALINGRG
ncbi:MAG: hypothetical protein REI11_11660 [Patulibacter sp.]|nr:hypothetical protein [Patulibacter sp.]